MSQWAKKTIERLSGIDLFRMTAAILVVMIHTSPLESLSPALDFGLTHGLARVAVPFFFMASGHYLLSKGNLNVLKLKRFLKRTALVYGFAMVLYLPLNWRNGFFSQPGLALNLLRAVLFEGTVYHLWYLPAAMLGGTIVWALLRRLPGQALIICILLYAFGLLGDSYDGLAMRLPLVSDLYRGYFSFTAYTRNGLFFAPLFFLMGARAKEDKTTHWLLCLLALFAMVAETMLLRSTGRPGHDSMTVFLPITMALLFPLLLRKHGQRLSFPKDWSLAVYILHPLMIILLRGVAKALGMFDILIENSFIFFFGVLILSSLAGILYVKLHPAKAKGEEVAKDRCWIEISEKNLCNNVAALRRQLPSGCQLMAVVKDNAYGHGAVAVCHQLNKLGVRAFAVATLDEGVELRQNGILGDILVLGYTDPGRARSIKKYDLIQTLISLEHAVSLDSVGVPLRAHIAVDTGMHRLGIDCRQEADIKKCYQLKHIRVEGIFSHLCHADSREPSSIAFTNKQAAAFFNLLKTLKNPGKTHLQNSHGLLNYPGIICSYARVGIALYGGAENTPGLEPVLSLKSRVALIREVQAAEPIGYDCAFVPEKNLTIGVVPIGYGDGLPRSLSMGCGQVLINGCKAPIIGQICMDQMMVDMTGIPNVGPSTLVTIIGQDGQLKQTAGVLAKAAGSISNELLSRLGTRPKRIWG